MERQSLIDEKQKITLADEKSGVLKVDLIQVVGRGGTAIAYKGIRHFNGEKQMCIIKEYFPDESQSPVKRYYREKAGEPICIRSEDREEEKKRQEQNVRREIRLANEMYFDGKNNSPYAFHTEFLTHYGDSSYMILDTSEGQTLEAYVREKGRLSIEEAIESIERLLVIVEQLLGDKYCHGDIKGQNIWIRGEGVAKSFCLLDFGSVFSYDEYGYDLKTMSRQEKKEMADKIVFNEGIGCSSEVYRAPKIFQLSVAKARYIEERTARRAGLLLEAVKAITPATDLYSCIQVMFRLLYGEVYKGDGSVNIEKIQERTGCSESVAEKLLEMMKKNGKEEYRTADEVRKDLEILKTLQQKGAHPQVILDALKEKLKNKTIEIDERLLNQVKCEN